MNANITGKVTLTIGLALLLAGCSTTPSDRAIEIPLTQPSYSYSTADTFETSGKNAIRTDRPTFYAGPMDPEPVLDGYKNEAVSEPLKLSRKNKNNMSADIYVGYWGKNIYLYAEITDNKLLAAGDNEPVTAGDSIELFFSTNPAADPDRKELAAKDFHMSFSLSPALKSWHNNFDKPVRELKHVFRKTNTGCAIELLIPDMNYEIGCMCGLRDKQVNFDIAINDKDWIGQKIQQVRWQGDANFASDPSQWGYLIFSSDKIK